MKKINVFIILTILFSLIGCSNKKLTITIEYTSNGMIETKGEVKEGNKIIIDIKPNKEYELKKDSLSYNNITIKENNNTYSFIMPDTDVTIKGIFIRKLSTNISNLTYGNHIKQTYDLFIPENPKGLILFIHGGFWVGGSKEFYLQHTNKISNDFKDYIFMSMNYRLINLIFNDINYKTMLADIHKAIESVYDFLSYHHISINKFIITGHSAGGYLSLMYAYTKHKESKIPIDLVVSLSAPVDFTNPDYLEQSKIKKTIVSKLSGYNDIDLATQHAKEYSPINFTKTAVPTIICQGKTDTLVPKSEGINLSSSLEEKNIYQKLIIFNSGHSLDNDPANYDLAVKEVHDFLK